MSPRDGIRIRSQSTNDRVTYGRDPSLMSLDVNPLRKRIDVKRLRLCKTVTVPQVWCRPITRLTMTPMSNISIIAHQVEMDDARRNKVKIEPPPPSFFSNPGLCWVVTTHCSNILQHTQYNPLPKNKQIWYEIITTWVMRTRRTLRTLCHYRGLVSKYWGLYNVLFFFLGFFLKFNPLLLFLLPPPHPPSPPQNARSKHVHALSVYGM